MKTLKVKDILFWYELHTTVFAVMLPNSNCKLPVIEVAELVVWPCDGTKHVVFCKQTIATSKVKEHEPYLSDPMPKKKACMHAEVAVHAASPGRRPRCGGWQKVYGTGH